MTDAATAVHDRDARTAWTWGGALLLGCAGASVLGPFVTGGPAAEVVAWLRIVLFGAALIVFAFGLRGSGSLVQRRPLGVAALLVVAGWPLVERLVTWIAPPTMDLVEFYLVWGYVSLAVQIGAAVIAVVSIARARVVPDAWRWAPLWALLAVAAPQLIVLLVLSTPGSSAQDWTGVILGLSQLVSISAPLFLGILAILLARRPLTATEVQVFPPPS